MKCLAISMGTFLILGLLWLYVSEWLKAIPSFDW